MAPLAVDRQRARFGGRLLLAHWRLQRHSAASSYRRPCLVARSGLDVTALGRPAGDKSLRAQVSPGQQFQRSCARCKRRPARPPKELPSQSCWHPSIILEVWFRACTRYRATPSSCSSQYQSSVSRTLPMRKAQGHPAPTSTIQYHHQPHNRTGKRTALAFRLQLPSRGGIEHPGSSQRSL